MTWIVLLLSPKIQLKDSQPLRQSKNNTGVCSQTRLYITSEAVIFK